MQTFFQGGITMTLIKRIVKNSIQGIGIACTIYLFSGMIIDHLNHGTLLMENWTFSKQAVGTLLIGIAFSAPTEIYRNDKLPFPLKFLFHMGIGCTVYTIVGFRVGWIPVQLGWQRCLLMILSGLLAAFLIWLAYAFYYWKLARNINDKIQNEEHRN